MLEQCSERLDKGTPGSPNPAACSLLAMTERKQPEPTPFRLFDLPQEVQDQILWIHIRDIRRLRRWSDTRDMFLLPRVSLNIKLAKGPMLEGAVYAMLAMTHQCIHLSETMHGRQITASPTFLPDQWRADECSRLWSFHGSLYGKLTFGELGDYCVQVYIGREYKKGYHVTWRHLEHLGESSYRSLGQPGPSQAQYDAMVGRVESAIANTVEEREKRDGVKGFSVHGREMVADALHFGGHDDSQDVLTK
ncbi:hypothetical protein LTR78_001586 [Recurvomyces mirabilis]|uniref:Uncharacterized protein n=1 Tax=Recurvomyces mirabilis TaxID=574656 RepID=A0AAE1C525_9PEZI|nr:hypothetical protein LTR78_001586 [Recurvomyces mirabilis]KAK5151842.1 hypothetical protein LTS14_008976 [Recurvomyces mirabilis]